MENKDLNQGKVEPSKEKVGFYSRLWVISAYIWVFAFVPYFLKRKNEFVQFHAKQGVVLFVTEIILILISVIPIIGQIVGMIGFLFCTFLSIKGIIMGLTGKKWVFPLIGRYANKLKE
jgi:uncharacterized membrane protein